MKYLCTYSLFESNSFLETKHLINTINDICEDARDDGFEVKIKPDNDIDIKMISLFRKGLTSGHRNTIFVSFTKEEFGINDLKPIIDRLVNLMKSEDFYYHLEYVSEVAKRAAGVSMRNPIPRRIEFDVLNDYLSTPSDFTFSTQLDNKLRMIQLVFTAKFGTSQLDLPLEEKFEIRKTKKIKKHSSKGGVSGIIRRVRGEDVDFNGPDLTNKQIDKSLPTLEEIMDRLKIRYKKHKLGVDSIKYINSGSYGMAFIAGDKVIKLTSSKSEAEIAKGLIGKKMKRCVGYYDVIRIKEYNIYAILMDKAEKLSKKEKQVVNAIMDYEGGTMDTQYIDYSMKGVDVDRKDFLKIANEFSRLKISLDKQGIPTQDLHAGNVGKINGKFVHFDIMGDSSASISKIKKLSI